MWWNCHLITLFIYLQMCQRQFHLLIIIIHLDQDHHIQLVHLTWDLLTFHVVCLLSDMVSTGVVYSLCVRVQIMMRCQLAVFISNTFYTQLHAIHYLLCCSQTVSCRVFWKERVNKLLLVWWMLSRLHRSVNQPYTSSSLVLQTY